MNLANTQLGSKRKWLVAAGCFLMIMLGLGLCSSNKDMYLGNICETLGFKKSDFSLSDSIRYISTAIGNLFFAVLIAKFGARKLVGVGFALFIGFLLCYIYGTSLPVYYLGGACLGLGMTFCSTTMVSYLVNLWFPEKRGTVSGAILCANGIGAAIAAQVIRPMLYEGSEYRLGGYKDAYFMVLVAMIITGIVVTILVTEPKGAKGQAAGKKKPKGKQWIGISMQEATRKPYFYAAAVCVFLTGLTLQGVNGGASTHMKEVGVSGEYIANVATVGSLVLVISKFLAGFGYDKLGLRTMLIFCEFCGFAAFLCLALCSNSAGGRVLTMGYSVLSRLALPLETVFVPLIAADLFGEKDFAKLLGIFVAVNTAGYAVGSYLFHLGAELMGSYAPVLLIMAVIMLGVGITFQFILNAADRVRKKVMAKQPTE